MADHEDQDKSEPATEYKLKKSREKGQVADARISYVGDGDIADRNRKPWWRQFLDLIGL